MSERPRFEKLAVVAKVRTREQDEHFERVRRRNEFLQSHGREGQPLAIYTTGPKATG